MKTSRLAATANPGGLPTSRAITPGAAAGSPLDLPRRAVRRFLAAAIAYGAIALAATSFGTTLWWSPNTDAETERYLLKYGTASGSYTQTVDTGKQTSVALPDLKAGTTYYFVVLAVNTSGLLSSPSPELAYQIPDPAAENRAPVAQAASLTLSEDGSATVVLSASDADGDPLSYTLVSQPAKGALSGTPPNLTYTPNADANGADSFTFKAGDSKAVSNTATVSITITPVNDAPVAAAKTVTTAEDTPVAVVLSATDKDGDPLSYTLVSQPAKGSLSGTPPNLTYTPHADANGADSFTFKAGDSKAVSNTATVSITITPVNDAPVAAAKSVTTSEDTPVAVVLSATDKDGDPLSYTLASQPAKGALSGTPPNLTYTPNADANGADSFTFKAGDSKASSNTATVSITITPVNDAPVAAAKSVTTAEDTPVAVVLSATDKDGDPLSYTLVSQPAKGSLTGTPPNLTYTPNADANGADSFTFKAGDSKASSNTATVSITITPKPLDNTKLLPQTGWSLVSTDSEQTGGYEAVRAFDGNRNTFWHTRFLSNATNPPHEIVIRLGRVHSLQGFRYLPRQDGNLIGNIAQYQFHTSLDGSTWQQAASGTFANTKDEKEVAFSARNARFIRLVALSEANGAMHAAAAEIGLLGSVVNSAPRADALDLRTTEGGPLAVTLGGDDPEDGALAFVVTSWPAHGTLTGTPPALTYTPADGFAGTDSFVYQTSDGELSSELATVAIAVAPKETAVPNHAPFFTVNPLTAAAGEDGKPYHGRTLAGSATDPDQGDSVRYSKIGGPSWLTVSSNGSLAGTPPAGSAGTHEFAIRATDKAGAFADARLRISIREPALPLPWESDTLGELAATPLADHQSGRITLTSAGNLAGTSDAGTYVWQSLAGDGRITARIGAIRGGRKTSRAGLMIRGSLAGNARHVFIGVNGDGNFRWVRRSAAGKPARMTPCGAGALPDAWLRLVRKGQTITAYHSADGKKWTRAGAITMDLGNHCHVGLVTSGGKGNRCSATFRDVSVKP